MTSGKRCAVVSITLLLASSTLGQVAPGAAPVAGAAGGAAAISAEAPGLNTLAPPLVLSDPGLDAPGGDEAGAPGGDVPGAARVEGRNDDLPNHFQRFVEQATGARLDRFGADHFRGGGGAFGPLRNVPVPDDYVLGPGDLVLVMVTGFLELNLSLEVDPAGRVVLPKVGAIALAGVRAGELERFLTEQLSRSFRNFSVSARLAGVRSIDIYVVGNARKPGKHTLSNLTSLVNAVFATGGPSGDGSLRRVQLRRDDKVVTELDLYAFMTRGERDGDVSLLAGDILVFLPTGPQVALLGSAKRPAIYELREGNETVGDLLTLQGGLPVTATDRVAHLERIDRGATVARQVETFALDEAGLRKPLRDGDVLRLFSVSPAFGDAVTLRGHVAAPGRYPLTGSMRVSDLLPNADALIDPDYYQRKNGMVLRDDLALDATRGEVKRLLEEINWDYAVVERLDKERLLTKLLPFHLGKAVFQRDPAHDLVLEDGDVLTVFGQNDVRVPKERRTQLVRIEGEVAAPGVYELLPGETLPGLIGRIGGLTKNAFAFGTTLRRESVRVEQQRALDDVVSSLEQELRFALAQQRADLGSGSASFQQAVVAAEEAQLQSRLASLRGIRADGRISLELDPKKPALPELVLEDGDTVLVPTVPTFVSVVGAVRTKSSLAHREGRRVDDYLKAAGLTSYGDVEQVFLVRADGSVLSRGQGITDWFGNSVRSAAVLPGDVVVVPPKVITAGAYAIFVRELKDWTQILANIGLTAAIGLTAVSQLNP